MVQPEGAGFDTYEVVGFFNLLTPSSRTVALGSTESVTGMSTRNLPEVNGDRPADNLIAMCEPIV
jgi:hypothetical protein